MAARRSRSEWARIIKAYKRSGWSHDEFCAEQGLNVGSFRGWLYRVRRASSASSEVALIPVDVTVTKSGPVASEIVLAVHGVEIRVGIGTDSNTSPLSSRSFGRDADAACERSCLSRRGARGPSARSRWSHRDCPQHVELNPFDGHLFVFLGRRLDRVKILVWDRNGFVLYYKRLSQGRFRMPQVPEGATRVEMDATTLAMLLDGIDIRYVKRPSAWTPPAVDPHAAVAQVRARRRRKARSDRSLTRFDRRARAAMIKNDPWQRRSMLADGEARRRSSETSSPRRTPSSPP